MDLTPIALARILLPRTPHLVKTAFLNPLSLSPNASKQDLRTELTVAVLRELLKKSNPIGKFQKGSIRDPGIKGKFWISKVTMPKPEDSDGLTPAEALDVAFKELGDGSEIYTLPDIAAVEAEWTGYRAGVEKSTPRPEIPEEEQYQQLMSEVNSNTTILYFHGGVFVGLDPASHRPTTSHLARLTSGRVCSVRYRLAPQNPFPSAVLDGLVAYLSLLSPPPGSFHTSVPASKIVFAGDSAGGNLSLVLLQTILTLQRCGFNSIRFHGKDVPIQPPAGLALNSPWCDVSRAMPSGHANAKYDYIPPPADFGLAKDPPADEVWPVTPPRIDLYVSASALIHPLVSPLAASADVWKGAPPVYMCVGNEGLQDEIEIVARRMNEAGVGVVLDGYEGMPHCFGMIFPQNLMGRECMNSWGAFIKNVAAEGKVENRKEKGSAQVTWAKAFSNPVEKVVVPWQELKKDLSDEEVGRLLREKRDRYVEKEEGMVREWREKQLLLQPQHEQQPSGPSQRHNHGLG